MPKFVIFLDLQPVAQPDNEESEEEFDNDLALVLHGM